MLNPSVDASTYDADVSMALADDSPTAVPADNAAIQSGWGAAAVALDKKASGDYPTEMKLDENLTLIRFLENAPFSVYYQHWIEREGKKSFVCLQTPDGSGDCPLCDIVGDKPRPKFAFNVVVCSKGAPSVQVLTASSSLARQIQGANEDPQRGPLTDYYWGIARRGTGPKTTYAFERYKARDLEEDWKLVPSALDAFAESATKYDKSIVYVTPLAELLTIARALV
jgi:hypothetical protein